MTGSHFSVSVVWVQVSSTTDRASVRSYTPAEMRVLRLLVRGLSYSGSAKALCVEPSTVKYHVLNMLQKTGLENKLQPAIAASEAKPVVELAEK